MKSRVILILERSGLVAADIEECIRETCPTSRVLHAKSLKDGEQIALNNDRIDLAIASSFTDQLPKSVLMRHLEASSTTLAISVPVDSDLAGFGTAHRLPTPFTSCALREMLDKLNCADDVAAPRDRP